MLNGSIYQYDFSVKCQYTSTNFCTKWVNIPDQLFIKWVNIPDQLFIKWANIPDQLLY